MSWPRDHRLSTLFPQSLVKTDNWITSAALGDSVQLRRHAQPLSLAGVGWSWHCWPSALWVISESGVRAGVRFTPVRSGVLE